MRNTIKFLAVLFSVITLSALMAHLFELRIKINLSKTDYQTVQQIYNGWQWIGIFEVGAIILTIFWLRIERKFEDVRPFLITAVICFVISLGVFFIFTFPANQKTSNWTSLPNNWNELREKWEYSHGSRAILYFIGFSCLIGALQKKDMVIE